MLRYLVNAKFRKDHKTSCVVATHLVWVAGTVTDGVKNTTHNPGRTKTSGEVGILQAGNERAIRFNLIVRSFPAQTQKANSPKYEVRCDLERILVSTWRQSTLSILRAVETSKFHERWVQLKIIAFLSAAAWAASAYTTNGRHH